MVMLTSQIMVCIPTIQDMMQMDLIFPTPGIGKTQNGKSSSADSQDFECGSFPNNLVIREIPFFQSNH